MARVKINECSFRDLMTLPGIGRRIAEQIMDLREACGNITETEFRSIGHIRNLEELIPLIDFQEYIPGNRMPEYRDGSMPGSRMPDYREGSMPGSRMPEYREGPMPRPPFYGESYYNYYGPPPMAQSPSIPRMSSPPPMAPGYGYYRPSTTEMNPGYGEQNRFQYSRPGNYAYERQERQEEPKKRMNLPKSISYDGTTKWQAFFAKFTTFADEQGWTAKQRKSQLCFSLEKKASEFYSMITEKEPTMEYFDLVKKLESRFGFQELPETSQMQFQYIRQKPEESVVEWSDRVISLANKAFRDLPEDHIQKQAVIKFCQGLADKEAGQYAINQRPTTLDTALEQVKWFQHTYRVMYGKQWRRDVRQVEFEDEFDVCATGVGARTERPTKSVHFSDPKPNIESKTRDLETKLDSVVSRMGSMEQKMEVMQKQMENMQTSITKLLNGRKDARKPRSPSPNRGQTGCFNCGDKNHFKRDCPQLANKKVSSIQEGDDESGEEENLNLSGSWEFRASQRSEENQAQ